MSFSSRSVLQSCRVEDASSIIINTTSTIMVKIIIKVNLTILLAGFRRGDRVVVAVRDIASKVVDAGCHKDVGYVPG